MIKQTQDQWFSGDYFASNAKVDLTFPDFSILAKAMGFRYYKIESDPQVSETLELVVNDPQPLILEVFVQETARVVPIVKFGNPNHVMEP